MYALAWQKVAEKVADLPNVIGYDIMNEPVGQFIMLTVVAGMFQSRSSDAVANILELLLGDRELAESVRDILVALEIIPDPTREGELEKWGFDTANFLGIAGLNFGFDRNYMLPFMEKIGKAILEVDPDAIIWVEHALGTPEWLLSFVTGGELGAFAFLMARPRLPQVVFAPHWYADIYPFLGFNAPMRTFWPREKRGKDYKKGITVAIALAEKFMGNVPVVLGEFGTYFTLTTPKNTLRTRFEEAEDAKEENFIIPRLILENYYTALDELFLSRIQWCWSWENTPYYGEGWNSENFSIVHPIKGSECPSSGCDVFPYNLTIVKLPESHPLYNDGYRYLAPRGHDIYSRPHPILLSGKPVRMSFWSNLKYFDPDKAEVPDVGRFVLEMKAKETNAPTLIFIPYHIYYPDGFWVWVSDGFVVWDYENLILKWYPEKDEPDTIHRIVIARPQEGIRRMNWDYFIKGDKVISRAER